jgi:hypothetical protein
VASLADCERARSPQTVASNMASTARYDVATTLRERVLLEVVNG